MENNVKGASAKNKAQSIAITSFTNNQQSITMELPEHLLILNDQNTVNGKIPELTGEAKERIKTVQILENSNLNCIPDFTFIGWSSLESVHIEDGTTITITTIGKYAFAWCSSLNSVNIPNGVTTIGENAFGGCESLQSVDIPISVTTIEGHAFQSCESLESINIPNTMTAIEGYTFDNCRLLRSLNIPNGVTVIREYAFCNCSSLQSVIIPNGVITIGEYAFARCSSLRSVNIPSTVTEVGREAFCNCDKLDQRLTNGPNYHPDSITWLRRRFDNLPIHRACYYVNDIQSAVNLLSSFIQKNHQDQASVATTDAMGMTPFDILCCNYCSTPVEMVQVIVKNDSFLQQQTGLSAFMLAAVLPGCGLDVVYALAMIDFAKEGFGSIL